MPRRKQTGPPPPAPIIHPRAVLTVVAASAMVPGCCPRGLMTEVKAGRLRASLCRGRTIILGRWLLDWIEAGVERRAALQKELSTCPGEE